MNRPVTVPAVEIQIAIEAEPTPVEDPPGALARWLVLRMPPYVAGTVARLLDAQVAVQLAVGADPTPEWAEFASTLQHLARQAAPGRTDDELHLPLAGLRMLGAAL